MVLPFLVDRVSSLRISFWNISSRWISDGKEWKSILLNKPDKGLLIPTMLWRELEDFSSGAVCLSIASHEFEESDYIREIDDFELAAGAQSKS